MPFDNNNFLNFKINYSSPLPLPLPLPSPLPLSLTEPLPLLLPSLLIPSSLFSSITSFLFLSSKSCCLFELIGGKITFFFCL